jgi:ADP-ribose pyrophosphatase
MSNGSLDGRVGFQRGSVEVLKRREAYRGFFLLDVLSLKHRLFEGGWSREGVRPAAVAVLPYDPERGRVVLVEQFRVGALDEDQSPWLMELVAGIVEPGESFDEVVRRESREETGLEPGDLVPVHRYLASPGGCSEVLQIYVARVDSRDAAGVHGLCHETEDIRTHVMDFDAVVRGLDDGSIRNAATIIAVQWLELHRKELDASWLS